MKHIMMTYPTCVDQFCFIVKLPGKADISSPAQRGVHKDFVSKQYTGVCHLELQALRLMQDVNHDTGVDFSQVVVDCCDSHCVNTLWNKHNIILIYYDTFAISL